MLNEWLQEKKIFILGRELNDEFVPYIKGKLSVAIQYEIVKCWQNVDAKNYYEHRRQGLQKCSQKFFQFGDALWDC